MKLPGSNHVRAVLTAARPEAARKIVGMLQRSLKWMHGVPRKQIPLRLGIADPAQRADIVQALARLPNFYSRDGRFEAAEVDATRLFMRSVGLTMPGGGATLPR